MRPTWKTFTVLAMATTALVAAAPAAQAMTAAQTLPVTTKTPTSQGVYSVIAPTADLTAVANAVQLKQKSVTVQVYVPPGIRVSSPVMLVVGATQYVYSPANGTRIVLSVSAPSAQPFLTTVPIKIWQNTSNGEQSYTIPWTPTLSPLYDMSFGPMTFRERHCFDAGGGDVFLFWRSPDGNHHGVEFDTDRGATTKIKSFASTWREVGANTKLLDPYVFFAEFETSGLGLALDALDPFSSIWRGILVGNLSLPDPMLPLSNVGQSRLIAYNAGSFNNSCAGTVTYQQTYTLDSYSSL